MVAPAGTGGATALVVAPPGRGTAMVLLITPLGVGEVEVLVVTAPAGYLIPRTAVYAGWDTGALCQGNFLR